jgi:hypothetical protein
MKICVITIKSKNGYSPTSLTILSDTPVVSKKVELIFKNYHATLKRSQKQKKTMGTKQYPFQFRYIKK